MGASVRCWCQTPPESTLISGSYVSLSVRLRKMGVLRRQTARKAVFQIASMVLGCVRSELVIPVCSSQVASGTYNHVTNTHLGMHPTSSRGARALRPAPGARTERRARPLTPGARARAGVGNGRPGGLQPRPKSWASHCVNPACPAA